MHLARATAGTAAENAVTEGTALNSATLNPAPVTRPLASTLFSFPTAVSRLSSTTSMDTLATSPRFRTPVVDTDLENVGMVVLLALLSAFAVEVVEAVEATLTETKSLYCE